MKYLQINAKFQPTRPHLYVALNMDGIAVRGKLPVLSLNSLSVELKVFKHFLYSCKTIFINLIVKYFNIKLIFRWRKIS